MFEYATGLAVARKNNTNLLLDTTLLVDRFPRSQITFRTYDLGIFTLTPEFTELSKTTHFLPIPGLWVGVDMATTAVRNVLGLKKIIKEKQAYIFDPSILHVGPNAFLWGFWQSPKYFEAIIPEIRSAFRFRHGLEGKAAEIAKSMEGVNSVAVHVRRGDYLLPKYKELYGSTNAAYYERAIALMASRIPSARFFIFSDDIAWCKDHLRIPDDVECTFVDRTSEGPHAGFHLQLMTLAKHLIITNSTFSWWGAWLNQHPGKIVIMPARWSSHAEAESLGMPGWIRI